MDQEQATRLLDEADREMAREVLKMFTEMDDEELRQFVTFGEAELARRQRKREAASD